MKTELTARAHNRLISGEISLASVGGGIGIGVGSGKRESEREKKLALAKKNPPLPGRRVNQSITQRGDSSLSTGKLRGRAKTSPALQYKAQRLKSFADFLLQRYRVKYLTDLPPGPQRDYRRLAERAGIPAYGLLSGTEARA